VSDYARVRRCLEAELELFATGPGGHVVRRPGGIATRLLAVALEQARGRGMTTTSLQASGKGKPVYARLGYRDLGPMTMWERRR
jgi:hypothetical protein